MISQVRVATNIESMRHKSPINSKQGLNKHNNEKVASSMKSFVEFNKFSNSKR